MKLITYFILIISMMSCSFQEKYEDKLHHELMKLDETIFDNYSFVIIIPEEGCSGCISEAESFYLEHKNDPQIFYIFTNISSIKSIKLRVGKDVINQRNVYIDIKNKFLSIDYNINVYPIILDIRNREKIEFCMKE